MLNYHIRLEGTTMRRHCSQDDVDFGETPASLRLLSLDCTTEWNSDNEHPSAPVDSGTGSVISP